MNFIDNYGHVFSMPSYKEFPIGYEYEETNYIFWINKDNQSYLSINNYYSKVINIVVPCIDNNSFDDVYDIKINIDSEKFFLINSSYINNKLNALSDINEYLTISEDNIKQELTNDDLFCIKVTEQNKDYYIIPLYVIGMSNEEGSWYTNILISLKNKAIEEIEYSYITVGGEFIDEYEQLVINGRNMGVNLPKDIIKGVYQGSYYNTEFNTDLYNQKLKEYLLNYMGIKGELGNFNSVEKSIEWFGWGEDLSISKLLQTDNEFKTQFIRDYFNINNDLLDSFKTFRNSTYISLKLPLNKETGENNEYDYVNYNNSEFLLSDIMWDGGTPKLESLLNKQVKVEYDGINYIKNYYDYNFIELGLKLACFKLFLKQYFLPIHLSIKSMSLDNKVYTNDIKVGCYDTNISITNPIIESYDKEVEVIFNNGNNTPIILNNVEQLVDCNYNQFIYKYDESLVDLYQIPNSDITLNIPISIHNKNNDDGIFNCTLILSKENEKLEYPFYIDINFLINVNDNIQIYDYNGLLNNENLYMCYSYDSKIYSPYYLGWNNLTSIIKKLNEKRTKFNIYLEDDTVKIKFEDNSKNNDNRLNNLIIDICKIDDNGNIFELNSSLFKDKTNFDANLFNYYDIYFKYNNSIIYIENKYKNEILQNIKTFIDIKSSTGTFNSNISIIDNFYIRIKSKDDKIKKVMINSLVLDEFLPILNSVYILEENNTNIEINNKFYWINGNLFIDESDDFMIILEESKNYEIFTEELVSIKFFSTSVVIYESQFIFDGSKEIYNNFIIYPKFMSDNIDKSYWVNNKFNIKLLVNGMWFNYDFETKVIEPYIEMGKLEYIYNEDTNIIKNNSYFTQLSYLSDTDIKFNSYMYSKDLSIINHNNFIDDYMKYYNNSNLKYCDNKFIGKFINDDFYYYITYNNHKIYIHNKSKGDDFIYDKSKLNEKYITINYGVDSINNETIEISKIKDDLYSITTLSSLNNNIIPFYYNSSYDKYAYNIGENSYGYCDIYTELHYDLSNTFLKKYKEIYNVTDNKKYYNNIHIYDLLKEEIEYVEKYIFTTNSYSKYDNSYVLFKDYNYKNISNNEIISEIIFDVNDLSTTYYTYNSYENLSNKVYIKYKNNNNFSYLFYNNVEDINNTYLTDSNFYYTYDSINENDLYATNSTSYFLITDKVYAYEYTYIHNTLFSYGDSEIIDDITYSNIPYILNNVNPIIFSYNYNFYLGKINYLGLKNKDHIINSNALISDLIMYNYIDVDKLYFKVDFLKKEGNYYAIKNNLSNNEYLELIDEYTTTNNSINNNYKVRYNFYKNIYKKEYNTEIITSFNGDDSYLSNEKEYISYNNNYYLVKDDYNSYNYFNIFIDTNNYFNEDETEINLKFELTSDNDNIEECIKISNDNITSLDVISNNESKEYIINKNDKINIYFKINKEGRSVVKPKVYKKIVKYNKYKYNPDIDINTDNIQNNIKYDITLAGEKYSFNNNLTQEILDLYNSCFMNISITHHNLTKYYIQERDSIKLNSNYLYDFYLMHDYDYWYGIYISRDTIENFKYNDLIISNENKVKEFANINNENIKYKLEYYKSDQQLLINRFKYIPANGNNIFNNDDLIVISHSNMDLPINIFNRKKWSITPISLGIGKYLHESNSEMCIMNYPENSNKLYKGYYNVNLKYNIDKFTQQQFENETKLLIK